MFCDIRDFTRHSPKCCPAEEKQVFPQQVFLAHEFRAHPGLMGESVDKIMGDCVMGLFPEGRAAVAAAVDMRLRLQEFQPGDVLRGETQDQERDPGIAKGEGDARQLHGSFEKLSIAP